MSEVEEAIINVVYVAVVIGVIIVKLMGVA